MKPNKIRIEFLTSLDAAKAANLFNLKKFHNFGYTVFDISQDKLKLLKDIRYYRVSPKDHKYSKDFKFVVSVLD